MPNGAEQSDSDLPLSNLDVGEEMLSDDVSAGAGAESAAGEGEFEVVPGFQPPPPPMVLESVAELPVAEATSRLPDIGEASFGAPLGIPETVHGKDDRVRITNTSPYPWRAHASLRITAADDSAWIGTGWFIGPRILVTAGHVVYIKGSGVPGRDGWVKKMVVMPGRNGAATPYGSVTATRFWTVRGWANDGDPEYDYGAIILTESLGNQTGWFGFGNWSDLSNVGGNISGYPGDKPPGTQWYAARRIDSVSDRKVYYDIDTAGGQSGSAVYRFINGQRYGMAIHAYGGTTVNSGTRINSAVFKNLKKWKDSS